MFYINKWQRLVFGVGAIVCAFRSFSIWWNEDGSPGSAFVAAIIMAAFALGPKKPGEEALPFATHIRENSRTLAIAATGLVVALVIIAWAVNRESDYAAEEAAADTVEMPAEEALPTYSSPPIPDAMAPAPAPEPSVSDVEETLGAMEAARAARRAALEAALEDGASSETNTDEADDPSSGAVGEMRPEDRE